MINNMSLKIQNAVTFIVFPLIVVGFTTILVGKDIFSEYETLLFWAGYYLSYPYSYLVFYFLRDYDYKKDKTFFWVMLTVTTLIGISTSLFYLFFTMMWVIFPTSILLTILYFLKRKNLILKTKLSD